MLPSFCQFRLSPTLLYRKTRFRSRSLNFLGRMPGPSCQSTEEREKLWCLIPYLLDVVLVLLWFFCLFVCLQLVTEGSKKAGGSSISLGGFQRNEAVLIHLKKFFVFGYSLLIKNLPAHCLYVQKPLLCILVFVGFFSNLLVDS